MIRVFFDIVFKKGNRYEWMELQEMLHEEQRLQQSIANRPAANIVSQTLKG